MPDVDDAGLSDRPFTLQTSTQSVIKHDLRGLHQVGFRARSPGTCLSFEANNNYLRCVRVQGDSSVFVLSRTGHFGYSSIHNSVNIIDRTFMLHLHGSCHMCFNV